MRVIRRHSPAARWPMRPLGLIVLLSLAGCGGRWRSAIKAVQSQPAVQESGIEPYLRATRVGRWTYECREVGRGDIAPRTYVREANLLGTMEGKLLGREFLPIEQYLRLPPTATAPAEANPPQAPLKGGTAFMFELTEPIDPYPPELAAGQPITSTSPIRYYDYDGRLLSQGTLTRTAQIEGVEEVECPAGRFPDCLRLRVDFTLHLPWLIRLDWSSYLWLSTQVGEVRRLEHMSGWFWILWFSGTHEYLLVSSEVPAAGPGAGRTPPPRWRYGAVVLNRAIPRPQIGGLVVDFTTSPASAPATAPPDSPATAPVRQGLGTFPVHAFGL
ncbi:MAG: hypothetical protein HY718_15545 [Planctomycetes bacterium]|nr:hypothetical protein [Planctomycetota bacterium]